MRVYLGTAIIAAYLAGDAYSALPGVTWKPDAPLAYMAGAVVVALFGGPVTRKWRRNGDDPDPK